MTLPAGVYSRTYSQDQALIRTGKQWSWFIGFVIFIFTIPLIGGGKIVGTMNITGIMLIAVVGLQITIGYAGQINLGQSAFMGVGSFITSALFNHYKLSLPLTLFFGGLGAAIFGAFFGLAALRIKGFYMALTTLAAQYIFVFAIIKLPKTWFGQAEGLRLEQASFLGISLDTDSKIYYFIFSVAAIMIYGAWGIVRSRTGRALIAVRDNDNAAAIIGVNVAYYKCLAFFIGSFYAGIAGGLWAYYIRYIQADQFTLWMSVWYVSMLILGGMGSILGAIVGTMIIRILQELITYLGPQLVDIFPHIGGQIVFASMNMLLGGIIILFIIFEPKGLVHRWNIIKENYRIWPFPH